MVQRSWLRWLLCGLCPFLLMGEPEKPSLYPNIRTAEALLRGSLPPYNTVEEARAKTCEVAARPLPAVLPLALFEDDRQTLSSYKGAWLTLCHQPTATALAEAYQLSLELEKMLREPIFSLDLPAVESDEPEAGLRIDKIYQRLDKLDQVVPAFFGTAEGFEYYAPNWTLFYLAALEGTDEDQEFFRLHFQLRRHPLFYPWIEAAADLGVCTLFGEYAWDQTLEAIEEALARVSHPIYVRSLQEWRAALLGAFEVSNRKPQICSCRTDAVVVLADGEKLLEALGRHESLQAATARLKDALHVLRSSKKLVQNYQVQGCMY